MPRTLRYSGEEQSGRGCKTERRSVMFGKMISVETVAIVRFNERQSTLEMLAKRNPRVVHVVEDSELRRVRDRHSRWCRYRLVAGAACVGS
jgi:hypothetical protein